MEYTEDQKEQFRQQFAVKRRHQVLLLVPLLVFGVLVALTSRNHGVPALGIPPEVIVFSFAVVALGAAAFSFWNWRCPACGKYLGRGLGPRFCRRCGIELR